jgi:hypothetical protein
MTWMGAECVPASPSPDDSLVQNDTVAIEMSNYTDYPIEPRLFIDPTPHITVEGQLIRDDNWVLVDPPLQPGELATYEFRCEDVGTMATDHAQMFISEDQYVESDNGPWLVAGDDFTCGDTVSLIFIDDGTVFFTRVEVNGQFLTD